MALNHDIKGLIGVDEVRADLGTPTADTRFDDSITDAEIEAIINRHAERIWQGAIRKLKQEPGEVSVHHYEAQTPALSVSTVSSEMQEASVPEGYMPVAFKATDGAGLPLDRTDHIESEIMSAADGAYCFQIKGDTIYVAPASVSSITIWLPKKQDLVPELMANEIQQTNGRIIQEAQQQFKFKVGEHNRTDQIEDD